MGQEEGQLLMRRVVLLQACVRGYLVRKRLRRGITVEYERIVQEIEGDLDGLRWIQALVPRPCFLPEPAQKSIKREELNGQGPGSNWSKLQEKEQPVCQEVLLPEKEGGDKVQLLARLSGDVVADFETGDPGQNLEHLRDKLSEDACNVSRENEGGKALSCVSSEWSSTILDVECTTLSQERAFPKLQELPQTMPDLQRHRKNLAMELLWLQQAIVSRKNYLILKQRLGSPR